MFLRCQRWAGRSPTADLSGGQLIAATQDALEEESFALPDAPANLGAMKSPDTEQLLALEVDFVILSANVAEHVKLRDFLEESGIPAAYFDVETFEDYLDMLKICTDIMGRADLYEQNGTAVQARIDRAIAKSQGQDAPTVLFIRAYSTGAKANGSDSMTGAMLRDLGCVNIADQNGSLLEELSMEEIIRQDPDFIFVTTMGASSEKAMQALAEGIDPELTGRFGTTNGGAMRATPVGIAFIPGNALAEEAWRSCVVTHNTMQGIESTTLVAAAVSLAIAGERGFLSKALAFVESQPPRGNWSAKASVVARVKMFMEWAVREDGSMSDGEFATILRRDCGTSVEANESVAAAFAIATRFFDKPTEALCFAASLGGDTDTIAAITGAMLGAWHGPDGFDPDMRGQVLRQLKDDDRLDLDRTVAGLCALREREA